MKGFRRVLLNRMPRKSKKVEQGQGSGLGRALMNGKVRDKRNKYKSRQQQQAVEVSATEIVDQQSADPKSGLHSVLEPDDITRLLQNADLSNREFIAEKLTPEILIETPSHADFVGHKPGSGQSILTDEELKSFTQRLVYIPRRPRWSDGLCETSDEFQSSEQIAFYDWLQRLSLFEQDTGVLFTPFERNIEVWRQLWRVLERSHVVVQIVDSRNPLLYYCEDLAYYVKELDDGRKSSILLLNKADLLSKEQRRLWYQYFKSKSVDVIFYSALSKANNNLPKVQHQERETESVVSEDNIYYKDKPYVGENSNIFEVIAPEEDVDDNKNDDFLENGAHGTIGKSSETTAVENIEDSGIEKSSDKAEKEDNEQKNERNPWDILGSEELIVELQRFCEEKYGGTIFNTQKYVVGLCGFPNVGKSSTLNSLVGIKKTAVSATPGRTKHFQTIHLTDKLILCDSPGLVMPTMAKSKAELIVNGILPIDQLRESISPVELIYERIDRAILEQTYGITLPPAFTATDFLSSLAFQRSFMSASGRPDISRASRIVIRNYTAGQLLYCNPPPGDFIDPEKFHSVGLQCCFIEHPSESKRQLGNKFFQKRTGINLEGEEVTFDREFFGGTAHVINGRSGKFSPGMERKPWKKHFNSNKKEKLRRRYAHLDA